MKTTITAAALAAALATSLATGAYAEEAKPVSPS